MNEPGGSSPTPRVAVISTVLNEGDSIAELLEGFLNQTRAPDRVVVVDGGSTDGTQAVLQQYAARDPRVRVVVRPGVNIARGRNIAIAHADADIVAVTDGGCRPERDWLQRLVQPLLDDASFGAVTGARRTVSVNDFEFYAGMLSTSGDSSNEKDRVFHGRNSAFRVSLWQAVGGYPEWLYTAEDTLFAQRAKALGCRVALACDAVVNWRPRPTLRKLARQYYLYGVGTGRIGMSDMPTVRWHLRNHAAWMIPLLLAPLFPLLLLVTLGVWIFLWRTLLRPAVRSVHAAHPEKPWWKTAWYVGGIVMVRSLANNWGQRCGEREYREGAGFKQNLEHYRAGTWRRADA